MRTRKHVIEGIFAVLKDTDYIGLSVEPIAIAADPDDEHDGDYRVNVIFEVRRIEEGEDKLFASSFQMSFLMDKLCKVPFEIFIYNLSMIREEAEQFCKDVNEGTAKPTILVGAESIGEMTDKLDKAMAEHAAMREKQAKTTH